MLSKEFRSAAQSFQQNGKVDFSFYNTAWQSCEPGKLYDLVLMSHCLYYFNDPSAAVEHGVNMLAPGGKLLVFHSTEKGLAEVRSKFTTTFTGKPYHYLTASEVTRIAESKGYNVETSYLPCRIDVTDCKSNPPIVSLLNWLANVNLETVGRKIVDEVREYVQQVSELEGERLILKHPVAALVIKKA